MLGQFRYSLCSTVEPRGTFDYGVLLVFYLSLPRGSLIEMLTSLLVFFSSYHQFSAMLQCLACSSHAAGHTG